ncbi:hypothetical protein Taro_053025 [Colocasia esculenta]|uniref:Uncharacterized protein n=1 Tax=Colocasia esculenta TaxID=4460 RepID=A0A843XLE5_COLES|nr:hypothetical protein [Colocasia esculenta]
MTTEGTRPQRGRRQCYPVAEAWTVLTGGGDGGAVRWQGRRRRPPVGANKREGEKRRGKGAAEMVWWRELGVGEEGRGVSESDGEYHTHEEGLEEDAQE